MKQPASPFSLSDLLGSKIVTAEGKTLGHVLDIQLTSGPDYRVEALLYGQSGLLHRFHVLNPFQPRRKPSSPPAGIPWGAVEALDHRYIRLKADGSMQK